MPDASAEISPLVTRARPPRAVGDVVLAAEPLRPFPAIGMSYYQ